MPTTQNSSAPTLLSGGPDEEPIQPVLHTAVVRIAMDGSIGVQRMIGGKPVSNLVRTYNHTYMSKAVRDLLTDGWLVNCVSEPRRSFL